MDVSTARFVQLEDCHHMVEVSALDQWMTSTADAEKGGLQLKVCPQCHTPIRHHLRYGAFIKTQIEDIETVKRRILGEGREKKSLLARLKKDMLNTRSIPFIKMKQKVFEAGHKETVGGLLTVRNQMRLLEEMRVIRCIARNERIQRFSFYDAMTKMEDWALRPRRAFSRQEVADAEAEIQRLWHWLALLGYLGKNDPMVYPRCVARAEKLKPAIRQMKEGARYTESHQGPMKELLKEVEKQFPAKERRFLPTCEEKPSLNLKVTPVGQGHWCKCPVGHIYACEDSADSATVSHCPECK